jgi:hypothetical protein
MVYGVPPSKDPNVGEACGVPAFSVYEIGAKALADGLIVNEPVGEPAQAEACVAAVAVMPAPLGTVTGTEAVQPAPSVIVKFKLAPPMSPLKDGLPCGDPVPRA